MINLLSPAFAEYS